MIKEDILEGMRKLVADSLAVSLDKVKAETCLVDDLGADSLDFVDILFQVEKKFGIKIKAEELRFFSNLDLSSPQVMRDGALTPETIERLKEWVPAISGLPDPSKLTAAQVFALISVGTLARLVEKKLA